METNQLKGGRCLKVVSQKYCEYCKTELGYNPWYSFFTEDGEVMQKPVCDKCISKCSYILKERENKPEYYQNERRISL